jgi:hypothetical protein
MAIVPLGGTMPMIDLTEGELAAMIALATPGLRRQAGQQLMPDIWASLRQKRMIDPAEPPHLTEAGVNELLERGEHPLQS